MTLGSANSAKELLSCLANGSGFAGWDGYGDSSILLIL